MANSKDVVITGVFTDTLFVVDETGRVNRRKGPDPFSSPNRRKRTFAPLQIFGDSGGLAEIKIQRSLAVRKVNAFPGSQAFAIPGCCRCPKITPALLVCH